MPEAECWHNCSKCKASVHAHLTCTKVHSDPSHEESHICDSCFVGSKQQPGTPIPASSPAKIAAAGVLLSLAAGSGDDAARKSADSSKTSDVGIRTSLIASQGTSGTASSCSRPVIISQPGQTREHARHTPRTESGMYKPPPVGADWTWNPPIIGADGAEAGPNGIATVCKETDASYVPNRGYCSVHEQRAVQQNKHNVFTGETEQKEEMAVTVTSMMEKVKNHSVTVPLAKLGKRMIADYLHEEGQEDAKKWFEKHHQHHKWTLIEMNDGTDAGGGVPCQANGIDRMNLQQKKDRNWEREKVLQFVQSHAEQVSQLSMNDLSFGDKMPRGYIQELGSGSSKIRHNKEVWTVNFFDTVKAEMRDPVGLHKLVWKANCGQNPAGSLIMCSRQMTFHSFDTAVIPKPYPAVDLQAFPKPCPLVRERDRACVRVRVCKCAKLRACVRERFSVSVRDGRECEIILALPPYPDEPCLSLIKNSIVDSLMHECVSVIVRACACVQVCKIACVRA